MPQQMQKLGKLLETHAAIHRQQCRPLVLVNAQATLRAPVLPKIQKLCTVFCLCDFEDDRPGVVLRYLALVRVVGGTTAWHGCSHAQIIS